MSNVLVLYATREGQTGKVAARIAQHLGAAGARARLVNAGDDAATGALDLDAFDLLVFGASMHAGGLEKELTAFVDRNADKISSRARSFFLVLLSAAAGDPQIRNKWLVDARAKMTQQLRVGFDDVEMIAGALRYSVYPLPVRWLMKRIARRAGEATDTSVDHEYTDWEQVQRYANRLVARLRSAPVAVDASH